MCTNKSNTFSAPICLVVLWKAEQQTELNVFEQHSIPLFKVLYPL